MEYTETFEDKFHGIKSPLKASLLVLGLFGFSLTLLILFNVSLFDILLFQSVLFFSARGFHPLLFQCHTQIKMDDMELVIEKQFAFYKRTQLIPLHKVKATTLKISGENSLLLQYELDEKNKSIQLCKFKKDEMPKIEALNNTLKENPFILLKNSTISLPKEA